MTKFFLSDLFDLRVKTLCESDQALSKAYGKVRCRFGEFSTSINMSFADLRIYQICKTSGEINKQFSNFLKKKRRKKESHRPHSEFQSEIWSIIERIIFAVTEKNDAACKLSMAELQAPLWMEPILEVLPRITPNNAKNRRKYPLTLNGEMILESLLKVSIKYNINCHLTLLGDYDEQLREDIKITPRGRLPKYALNSLSKLRQKLKITKDPLASKAIKFENWPSKLKKQFENYEELATTGVKKNSNLDMLAEYHKVKLQLSKKETINTYKKYVETGLWHSYPLPEDLGVEDFLSLKERKISICEIEYVEKFNEYVDKYRKVELNRNSISKRAGFDSVSFDFFTNALIEIGKYNLFFPSVKNFAEAYTLKLDLESKQRKKVEKKEIFTIQDIDQQIKLLEVDVNRIIDGKLFKNSFNRSISETKTALKKCLYFPILLTFRYMGLRQRNVRCSTMMKNPESRENPGGNIGIRKDGTLVFHFNADETKNKKAIHMEFNLDQHGETHGTLIRGLTRYFKEVHPFITRSNPNDVGEKCFVYIPKGNLKFKQFSDSDSSEIYNIFTSWSTVFLKDFLNKPERYKLTLNPHFFRGVCCDWLYDVLKFTFDKIGEYIGDIAKTVYQDYIKRNRTHDATFFVTTANAEIRLNKKEVKKDDEQIEALTALNIEWQLKNIENQEKIKFLEDQVKKRKIVR